MSLQQKKSMTSVDVKAWIEETRENLRGVRVQNIYSVEGRRIILFKMKISDYKYLLLEPGKRAHLTRFTIELPQSPDLFTVSLRKYLRDQTIEELEQVGFDRILKIVFKNGFSLYIEILPRGEAILVDVDGKIVQATEFKIMKDREIKRGLIYTPPPLISKIPSVEECEIKMMEGKKQVLSKELGIPPEVIYEAEKRGKITPHEICYEISRIIDSSGKDGGFILLRNNKPVSFHPFYPTPGKEEEIIKYEKFNDAIDEFYLKLSTSLLKGEMSEEELKLSKMIEAVSKEIEEYQKRANELYELAGILMSKLSELRELKECVEKIRKEVGWERVKELCPGIVEANPSIGKVKINFQGIEVEIPITLDPYEYAQQLFDEAKKLKRKAESAKEHLLELKGKLELEAKKREQRIEALKSAFRRKSWYERFRWSITRNGFLIIAGRDVQQNTALVRRYLKENDIYLHADIQGAPSTILITEGKIPNESDIYDAAVIAASYSKGWNLGLPALDVFWVKGEQVSLSPPSGEYLRKGSFMVYGQKNYLKAIPLVLYLGIQTLEDGNLRLFVGSEESARKNSTPIAILMPGDMSPEETVKKLISIGMEKGLNLSSLSEEIKKALPGKSRIKALTNK